MARRVEQLVEHERRVVEIGDQTARDLVSIAMGKLSLSPTTDPGHYEIAAQQWVGTLVTERLELVIRPKIPLDNLFLLLGVGLPPAAWRPETFAYGTTRDLLPAFASFFARTLERTLSTGLLRAYREAADRLPALRGRIDFAAQLSQPAVVIPVACRFDDFTADIIENRILKAAIRRLLRVLGVPAGSRRLLLRELARFEEVVDTHVAPEAVDRVVFTRLNRHYAPALRLAALVLRNTALLDRAGTADASAFLVDMNDVFQRFLTDGLRRALRGRLAVDDEPIRWLDRGHAVAMYPDLAFRAGDETVYVADAKYKLTGTGRARNPDYYQLLAYTTAMNLPEGVLVYCQADGPVPPRGIEVRHTGRRLLTYALDLSGSPTDVIRSVNELARWVVGRVEALAL
jgi:5-methylcytosine-specific restriction enzyme subunit McrC